jgi:2-dehydro-3-deoxygalactonokinase
MKEPLLISVDWGTSNFRAFLLGNKGEVLTKRSLNEGIMKVSDRDFPTTFNRLLCDWLNTNPNIPVLMSGMIGSEQGWSLAPHVKLPAGLGDLAAALHPVKDLNKRTIYIVPGLTTPGNSGVNDIIRGEETQIIGGLNEKIATECVLCLPGTHSKWVTLTNGIVTDFRTSLTGEVLDVLTTYSIIGRLIKGKRVGIGEAFILGLNRSGDAGGLLHHLFGVRSQGFTKAIKKQRLKSYLAGILIGHEIRGMKEIYSQLESTTIIAGKEISVVYKKAFDFFSIESHVIDGQMAAIQGHMKIAEASGLI